MRTCAYNHLTVHSRLSIILKASLAIFSLLLEIKVWIRAQLADRPTHLNFSILFIDIYSVIKFLRSKVVFEPGKWFIPFKFVAMTTKGHIELLKNYLIF